MCFNSPNMESQTLGPGRALATSLSICSFTHKETDPEQLRTVWSHTVSQWQSPPTLDSSHMLRRGVATLDCPLSEHPQETNLCSSYRWDSSGLSLHAFAGLFSPSGFLRLLGTLEGPLSRTLTRRLGIEPGGRLMAMRHSTHLSTLRRLSSAHGLCVSRLQPSRPNSSEA